MPLSARLFRTGTLLLLACVLVWALVLAWWADEERTPSTHDMVLYMAALPLALVGGFVLLKRFIDGLRQAAIAPARVDAPPSAPPAPSRSSQTRLALRAGFLRTAAGDDAAQLRKALAAGKRPAPDPEFRDVEGFPVFAARIDGLACDALRCEVDELAGSLQLAPLGDPAMLRALAALELLLGESLDALLAPDHPGSGEAAPVGRVLWFVPQGWPAPAHALLATWLRGRSDDPALALAEPQILPVRSANELARQLAFQAAQIAAGERLLVLATESFLGEDTLLGWGASGRLFSPVHQHGRVPGEASAALLLTPCGESGGAQQALAMMSAPRCENRSQSADAPGRTHSGVLSAVLANALESTATEPLRIDTVVSDIDHRATRSSELFAALGADFDHLDPTHDVFAVATSCGDTGIVAALLCIILAGETARERNSPVLCLLAQHALERSALVLTPVAEPPIT